MVNGCINSLHRLVPVLLLLTILISCEKDNIISTVNDIDGNVYNTVTIGTQVWMAENLRTTTYNNKAPIILGEDSIEWINLKTGAYCWYDNDEISNSKPYGALYSFYAVETGNLCPDGWHVPTDSEWTTLLDYLSANGHLNTEGSALKSTSGWYNNGNGTDDFGFAAHPGGYRYWGDGSFRGLKESADFWSATEANNANGNIWYFWYNSKLIRKTFNGNMCGYSVRCVKD